MESLWQPQAEEASRSLGSELHRQRTVVGMQPHLPPLDCLLAALAVSRTGSFSAAADELGVTHAAVSRRVAGAESWAGMAIFRRHARGAVLTADGERLLGRVSQGLDLIDRAADRGRKVRGASVVRLATTASFANHWLLDRLAAAESAAGGVRIEVDTQGRLVDLKREGIDLAVRYGVGGWKGMRERRLFKAVEQLVPVVSRAMLSKPPARLTARELAAMPLLHNGDASGWRVWFEAHGIAFRPRPTDRTLVYYHLTLAAARGGLGAALQQTPPLDWSDAGGATVQLAHLAVPDTRHWFLLQPPEEGSPSVEAVAAVLLGLAGGSKQRRL